MYGEYTYYMPVKVISGRDCVVKHARLLSSMGKRALIVTGKSSALNGALKDVREALLQNGQEFSVFDEVTPNPTVACVQKGAEKARAFSAEFVVGIGGGSPLDAAKAVAALARQPRGDGEIFSGGWTQDVLPVVAVPTTAGTGSEVTQYAVLTDDVRETKSSISSPALFPKISFLDGKYMERLGRKTTVHTAVDALSHAVEGMFTEKSTPISDVFALESIRLLFSLFPKLEKESPELSLEDRDALLYASLLAGTVIAQSGTTAVHAMGYFLTYYHGADHGEANGVLLGEMLALCFERLPETVGKILRAAGLPDVDSFKNILKKLLKGHGRYAFGDLRAYAKRASENPKLRGVTYRPEEKDLLRIFLNSDIAE